MMSPLPRRFDPAVPEMMDRPGNDPALLRADLSVLENINRLLGGHAIPLRHLRRWRRPSLTILDLATGGGDVPRAIVRWARRAGVRVAVTAVDANPEILAIARERSAAYPEIDCQQHDLLALPYGRESYDVVLNALTLHHFGQAAAIEILRRVRELARVGYVVNDLRRRRAAVWISRWAAKTLIRNPIARFDAPASCERAFSIEELREMIGAAGLVEARLQRGWGYRWVMVGEKPPRRAAAVVAAGK